MKILIRFDRMTVLLHEFSLKYIKCVHCKGKLELDVLREQNEINEGFLYCKNCKLTFPIISSIPILRNNFVSYLSNRSKLGGRLYLIANHRTMKLFVKKSLTKIKKLDDKSGIEERWTKIYLNSKRAKFYSVIREKLAKLPKSKLALEHGCSIGITTSSMAKNSNITFGIDNSFSSILAAKKNKEKNLDYFVSDSLEHPFGNQKFNLVVALNLLELVEPKSLIKTISKQINTGNFVLSDPYDYDRGKNSVKNSISSELLRKELEKYNFRIHSSTKKPSFLSWNLRLNDRTQLCYLCDVIIGQKS